MYMKKAKLIADRIEVRSKEGKENQRPSKKEKVVTKARGKK